MSKLREKIRKLILDNHVAIQVNGGVECRVCPPEVIDAILSLFTDVLEEAKPKEQKVKKMKIFHPLSIVDDIGDMGIKLGYNAGVSDYHDALKGKLV